MLRRHWPALSVALAVLAAGLNLQAQPAATTAAPGAPAAATPDLKDLITRQQELDRRYRAFTTNLLALAQKLEKSDRLEDKDKAKALRKAIELADKEGVDNKFTMLLRTLTKSQNLGLADITAARNQNDDLIKVLKEILNILQSDDELARIRAEKEFLEKLLADLNGIIRATNINQSRTDSGKGDAKQLAKDQKTVAEKTAALADKMGAAKTGKPTAGDPKGGGKGEPKEDDKAGDGKADAKDPKAGERANGDKNDPMKSDGADAKGGKPSDDGAGAKAGGPPKDGQAAGSKPMGGDPKGRDPKAGDPKKDGDKTAEKRGREDNKGDQKGSAAKSDSPKSDAQASAKSQGSPSGSPSGQPKPGGSPPPSGNQPPPPPGQQAPGAEAVRKAVPDEENAVANLDQNKRPKASEDLSKADQKLREAREELEKRLKQLREQELERILANLEARVSKMLAWQIEVKSATVAIHAQVQKHPEKKAQPVDFQNAQKQEDKEGEIINEADRAIELLRSEGSAVAFPAVFEEVRQDMFRVKERLHEANVGDDTQAIEQDIIDSLTHMRDALKKAQQELGKKPPSPPGPPSEQTQLQKLLDEIAELKMIRQLQVQVNDRTKRYGNKAPGEQADDPQVQRELRDLGERQEKIETMVNNLVTKKNQ